MKYYNRLNVSKRSRIYKLLTIPVRQTNDKYTTITLYIFTNIKYRYSSKAYIYFPIIVSKRLSFVLS